MTSRETDSKNIWHPFTPLLGSPEPLHIVSGSGVYLTTSDGRKIIDAVSSWWVNIHGHSNPHIADAIASQSQTLEHVIFAGFTHDPAIRLSKNLLSILPHNQSKVFFSDNGSTAVEVALKMAFQYWHNQGIEKRKVVALNGAYHGDTFGSMSVGERGIFTEPFSKFLFDVDYIDFPDGSNDEHVVSQLSLLLEKNDTASFIYEPLVQGASGMRMYSPETLQRLLTIAHKKNVICIADEVFTGFGRTGKIFASEYMTAKPDIICLSKGITGGFLPLGVTTCSEEVLVPFQTGDPLKTFYHGHSYTANPIACAAANASFELLVAPECQHNIARIAAQHFTFAKKINHHPSVKKVRNLGTILALEIDNDEHTSYLNSSRKKIYSYFLERNILLRPLGNITYILPPYVISNAELAIVYQAIEDFLNEIRNPG